MKTPIYCQCHGDQIVAMLTTRGDTHVLELKTKRHGVWHTLTLALRGECSRVDAGGRILSCGIAETLSPLTAVASARPPSTRSA